jgi:hypothetical protein
MATMQKVGSTATSIRGHVNTRLQVQYHATVVVDIEDGVITLNSGGWRTSTTKARMNQASNQYGLGYQVSQKAGAWTVHYKGNEIPFMDGMKLG